MASGKPEAPPLPGRIHNRLLEFCTGRGCFNRTTRGCQSCHKSWCLPCAVSKGHVVAHCHIDSRSHWSAVWCSKCWREHPEPTLREIPRAASR